MANKKVLCMMGALMGLGALGNPVVAMEKDLTTNTVNYNINQDILNAVDILLNTSKSFSKYEANLNIQLNNQNQELNELKKILKQTNDSETNLKARIDNLNKEHKSVLDQMKNKYDSELQAMKEMLSAHQQIPLTTPDLMLSQGVTPLEQSSYGDTKTQDFENLEMKISKMEEEHKKAITALTTDLETKHNKELADFKQKLNINEGIIKLKNDETMILKTKIKEMEEKYNKENNDWKKKFNEQYIETGNMRKIMAEMQKEINDKNIQFAEMEKQKNEFESDNVKMRKDISDMKKTSLEKITYLEKKVIDMKTSKNKYKKEYKILKQQQGEGSSELKNSSKKKK